LRVHRYVGQRDVQRQIKQTVPHHRNAGISFSCNTSCKIHQSCPRQLTLITRSGPAKYRIRSRLK
jgi:hypothetical protein